MLMGCGCDRALSLDPEVLANASPKLLYRTGLRYAFHLFLRKSKSKFLCLIAIAIQADWSRGH